MCVRVCLAAHTGCLWVSVSTHRPSGCVRQHTQVIRGCSCVSLCVRVCPSAHTGRPWLSISTRISTLVLGLSTLALTVDCWGSFGPRGLSCSVHTIRPWVSVSTHRTFVGVRQHTQDVRGCLCVSMCFRHHTQNVRCCPSVHISARGLSVQYTLDVRGCPPAHTGRPWLSVQY